jgi:hypothetical protein
MAPFSSNRVSCSAARRARTPAGLPEVVDEVHGLSHAPRMVETVERQQEGIPIVTSDTWIARYEVEVIR